MKQRTNFILVSHLSAEHEYYADPDYCKLFRMDDKDGLKEYLKERNAIYNTAFVETDGGFIIERQNAEAKKQDVYIPITISLQNTKEPTWEEEWDISPEFDITHRQSGYLIQGDRLVEKDWILHMSEKRWVDLNTFIPAYFEALRRLGCKEVTVLSSY